MTLARLGDVLCVESVESCRSGVVNVTCNETVYLIRNGGLHKIGIMTDFDRRMRELAPDHVQARLNLEGDENFTAADVERTLHARFKPLRIPQTEYFRLSNDDILECAQIMKSFSDQSEEPLEYTTTEVPMTSEEQARIDRFDERANVLEAEMDAAEAAGDEDRANAVRERCAVLQAEINQFRESIYAD